MSEAGLQDGSGTENSDGRFGRFGGRYVPETLVSALDEFAEIFQPAAVGAGADTEAAA